MLLQCMVPNPMSRGETGVHKYRLKATHGRAQVLGGAGPAIAAVPLTAIWAGGSVVTLLASVGSGKVCLLDKMQG